MCAIIGATNGYKTDIILNIFKNSRIRGLHSFGYSYIDNNCIKTDKFLLYEEFVESFLKIKPASFISHFRYSTSGDWNDHNNNQPINIGDFSSAFNGVIDMRSKSEMEIEYNINMITENDGEIALRYYADSENKLIDLIKNNQRTYAGIIINKTGDIIAIRNDNRPLYIHKDNNTSYIASTKDIFTRSGIENAKLIKAYKIVNI